MKRMLAMLLAAAMLLSLAACGEVQEPLRSPERVTAAPMEEPIPVSADGYGYIIPDRLVERNENDGTWGWITSEPETEVPETVPVRQGEHLVLREHQDGDTVFLRYDLEGNELDRLVFPREDTGDELVSRYYGNWCFTADGLWVTRDTYTVIDTETGEQRVDSVLQRWDMDRTLLAEYELGTLLRMGEDGFISGLAPTLEDGVLVFTVGENSGVYAIDRSGGVETVVSDGEFYSPLWDRDGRLYLEKGTVYTVDWENCALGRELFTPEGLERPYPGGGPYDFFLISESTLRGVTLANGTVTELLSWSDCELTGGAQNVQWVDESHLTVRYFDVMTLESDPLLLTRVPAAEVPQKTNLKLAVCIGPETRDYMTPTDALDQTVAAAVSRFNRSSPDYRIEVVAYAGAKELGTALAAGDGPDLIDWHGVSYQDPEDPVSVELLAKRGYLADLEPMLEEDPELAPEQFIPSIYNMAKNRTGGLHAVPLSFYFLTLSAPTDLVGDRESWSLSELLAAAKSMPEDMTLWSGMTRSELLSHLLRSTVSRFTDVRGGTCDLQNQAFYDLLTLCRDFCPDEIDWENYVEPDPVMIRQEMSMGSWQFYEDVIQAAEQQGRTLIGFPEAGGSGVSVNFYNEMSILSTSAHREADWEFLRTLLLYDAQYNVRGMDIPVRRDAWEDQESYYLENNRREGTTSVTDEDMETARAFVYNAENLRVYDSPIIDIILEEAETFFAGDRTAQETAEIAESRVRIFLGEQG